jgi:6-phosphogluconolactonase/glucosamine-6-phosphate isomerase/deaminase
MLKGIQELLQQKNIFSHRNEGILIAKVPDQKSGLILANDILLCSVDTKTLVLLSGGRTPWALYEKVAHEEKLQPGAVGMVDERFGEKWHETSNEKKVKETGLLRYLEMRGIPFYPMLVHGTSREKTAEDYDMKLRDLQANYTRSIALLGIGLDGHTAGIAGNRNDFKNPLFEPEQKSVVVSEFNDAKSMFKERVTLTFLGLSLLDLLIVLVFGDDKREALERTFSAGPEEEVPARFYRRPDIASKTLLITDQKV